MTEAFVYDAVRTPRGKGRKDGSLHTVRPVELVSTLLKALQNRNQLPTEFIEDVILGCVTQKGDQGACIARAAVLEAGYSQKVGGVTINRFCASALDAIHQASALTIAGYGELFVAGGVESMSRERMGTDGGAMWDPSFQWKVGTVPQGIGADLIATMRGFSRQDVDSFAQTSQERANEALSQGFFQNSVVPVLDETGYPLLLEDEFPRKDSSLASLGKLNPAFEMMGKMFAMDSITKPRYPWIEEIQHVHTAGNSSGIVDGASAVLIGNKEVGNRLGLRPRARIVSSAIVGDEPIIMLNGPIPSTRKALKRAKMTIQDIDLFEINEAFAAVPMAFMDEFGVDISRVNVHGGAIALGHPLGATGAMLLGTVLDALEKKNQSTGLITLCVAGGMGISTIIERV